MRVTRVVAAVTAAVLGAVAARGQTDLLTVGTVNVSSGTGQVKVPIYIQDNTGTTIGRDKGAGLRITGFAMQVVYGANACIDTPATAGQRIDLTGGILASQAANIDSRVKVAHTSQSWIYSSAESNGLIPFTAAAAPGDRIGSMVFDLTACPAGTINLVTTVAGAAAALLSSDSGASETSGSGLTVVNGAIHIVPPTGASFYTLSPCRVADTRNPNGPYGGPALGAGANRTFVIGGQCAIPSSATAVSFNFTITAPAKAGDLRVFPAGGGLPLVSTVNWSPGQTRANNAVVALGTSHDITVHLDQASGTAQLVIDVNGYFQ